jgi:hypothetical protein
MCALSDSRQSPEAEIYGLRNSSDPIKGAEFLNQMNDYEILKNNYAVGSKWKLGVMFIILFVITCIITAVTFPLHVL